MNFDKGAPAHRLSLAYELAVLVLLFVLVFSTGLPAWAAFVIALAGWSLWMVGR